MRKAGLVLALALAIGAYAAMLLMFGHALDAYTAGVQ